MRKFETPYMADWFAISLRWIALIGLVVSLGLGDKLEFVLSWPLGLLVAWNLVMTMLASSNVRMTYHRRISFGVDLLLTTAFFLAQGGMQGPAFWTGILPILTSAIYFEYLGAMLAAILSSALVLFIGRASPLAIGTSITLVLLSILFGYLGRRMIMRIRESRILFLDAEEKKRAIQTERMRAIYELTSELSSTLSYKRVLESALDISATALNPEPGQSQLTGGDPLVGMVMLFSDGKLHIGSARRLTSADMRVTFDAAEGLLKKCLDEGEPMHMKDIGYDSELGRVVALRNCTSGYGFPLRSGLNVYGVLLFAHQNPDYFNAERSSLLDIIGRQSVTALQNARLYQDLIEEKERMVEVHEEARKKLARDLHDGPTQSVAAIAMRLNITRRMMAKDTKAATEEIVKLEELAHRTTKEIRHMLFTLRPLILESQGLAVAVQSMAEKMLETFGQKMTVQIDEKVVQQLEMGKQGVIFYIIEEAVNNARKHASAEVIAVRLKQVEEGIALLEIQDNGVGFDVKAMSQNYEKRASSSLGMVNLRERSELVQGLLHLDSAIGKGTRVQVFVPMNDDAADRIHHRRGK